MKEVHILPPERYGYDFIPPEYLPPGKNEYHIRDRQAEAGQRNWRRLRSHEIEILVKNENYCTNWEDFLVADPFEPNLIRNSRFYGLIRIGSLRNVLLRHHDFCIPAGIRNSTVISCDIGNDCALQDCAYLSHYIIGDMVILSRIDEMQTTNHAKFGNGVLMHGEEEDVRIWIDVMNEAGGRSILPFRDMIPADAYLWAAYRDDTELTAALKEITQRQYGGERGRYGQVGTASVIKSCGVIKDADIGCCAYIKGANKLKNLSILSSEEEQTQIGEGVELVNGIIGYGSHIFYGSKAVRFVLGRNCNLKYGARLIHSVLGDNSTVSCCEILNNLIFPVHEQHHNNSFLIASLIQGMSNMAAGTTIGSNHNSRANDGEFRAGRGFWPGLSVTLKHSSRFASFVLIAKGDYPYELNIPLPFSLVNNNTTKDRLEVMPAYFWMYNMYALMRNSWKIRDRDKRKCPVQHIETDFLAPDTAEEIISALKQLESWMTAAGMDPLSPENAAPQNGRTGAHWGKFPYLRDFEEHEGDSPEDPEYEYLPSFCEEIPAEGIERHKRQTRILKPRKAYAAYREMLFYYSMKTIVDFLHSRPGMDFDELSREAAGGGEDWNRELSPEGRVELWTNLGGQITPSFRIERLREDIRGGRHSSWEDIHAYYDEMFSLYPLDRLRHAWSVLAYLNGAGTGNPGGPAGISKARLKEGLERSGALQRWISGQVYRSRAKDFNDPFRAITYRGKEEMRQVAGDPENNFFVRHTRLVTEDFEKTLREILKRL